ncbi:MAG: O-antigen ligase family protein [Actinobacteria bacterium]|nr:O-antigen ligase family protein [Actinomycetota bacterium]
MALAVVSGVVVGLSIANGQIMFAGLVAAFVLIVALAQAAWLPYAACVVLVSTIADPSSLPQFGIPGNPTLTDLVLVAAFGGWLLVLARGDAESPGAFPVAPQVAVGLFFVAVVGGLVVARANGASSALVEARSVAYYATFWLALTAFASAQRRALMLRLGAYAAVAVVVVQVGQGLIGPEPMLFYDANPMRELLHCPSSTCTDPWAEGFPRIRPPGLVLVYVAACFSASYLLWGPRRRRARVAGLLAVCFLGLLVSLNRNMIIGLVAGLLLAGLLATRRGRFAAVAALFVVLVVVTLEVARASPEFGGNSIAARVLSITAVSELESSDTVADRVNENHHALAALSSSPIEGLGWAVPYGDSITEFVNGEFQTRDRLFIHNQYLGLWLRTGLLGLVAFTAALGLSVVYGARWLRRRSDEDDAWVGAGLIASVTAIAFSSVVAIYIIHPSWAPVLAGLFALGANLQRELLRGQ